MAMRSTVSRYARSGRSFPVWCPYIGRAEVISRLDDRNGCGRPARITASRCCTSTQQGQEGLGDLDRVEGSAFAEVVAGDEEGQPVLAASVSPHAAHLHGVRSGHAQRSRNGADPDTGGYSQEIVGPL